jgi:peptide/nickel transport system substrate-binding protein
VSAKTVLVLATAAVLVTTAAPADSTSRAGGTYRVGWEIGWPNDFEWGEGLFSNGFDPAGETATFAIYTNLLLRTLVGYNHVAGPAGYRLVPDLAVRIPTPTNDGRTYSFTLKRGVRFGPPVNRAIRSADIRYAIERLARRRNLPRPTAPWPKPGRREQAGDLRAGREFAATFRVIESIVTSSPRTITFHLTRPTGDFLHRLALPAAAPIPPEVGRCFEGRPGEYGADLISSGPYMIEGAAAVPIGSCSAIRPMRGISKARLTLVRNPSYDPRTDTGASRENNPDRFIFIGGLKAVEIVKKLRAGELEDAVLTSSPKLIGRNARDAARRGALRIHSADWLHYVALNVTQPPFDDVHVRRAMSWVMDRAALRDAWGGAQAGPIAEHIVPDELLGNRLTRFAPFATPGGHGDLARAKAEMVKSRYATRRGVCTAKACKGLQLGRLGGPTLYAAAGRVPPIVEESAAKIGITFVHRGSANKLAVHLSAPASWIKHVADPASFMESLLSSTSIAADYRNRNHSLLGITPPQAVKLRVPGRVESAPSVDADLARCGALRGARRTGCYAVLDRKLSTEIVPWIPFLWRNQITILGPQVAKWAFDQSTGVTAFAHVAVNR